MRIVNSSRKVLGIQGKTLLPGETLTLKLGEEQHPTIQFYLKQGILSDADSERKISSGVNIHPAEREKIEKEAIERYKKEQAEYQKAKEKKEAEIKAIQGMKKKELVKKALGMGIEVQDSDTEEILKEKIIQEMNK